MPRGLLRLTQPTRPSQPQLKETLGILLEQESPQLALSPHERALATLQELGRALEAVPHALALGQFQLAADLIEDNASKEIGWFEYAEIRQWLSRIPREVKCERPKLWSLDAIMSFYVGDVTGRDDLLLSAREALRTAPPSKKSDELAHRMSIVGELARAEALGRPLDVDLAAYNLEEFGKGDSFFQSFVDFVVARSVESTGNLDAAIERFERMADVGNNGILARGENTPRSLAATHSEPAPAADASPTRDRPTRANWLAPTEPNRPQSTAAGPTLVKNHDQDSIGCGIGPLLALFFDQDCPKGLSGPRNQS